MQPTNHIIVFFILFFSITVKVLYAQSTAFDCQNFAHINGVNYGFRAGDIDVSGNKLTVEALVNNSGPYANSVSADAQDIVSKHLDMTDVNYLLRMNHAEITTTNGFFKTEEVCALTYGQTYHIAMVYDGSSLKFYRNGQLVSEKECSGNLILNDWITTIGAFAAQRFDPYVTLPQNETYNGYVNEVRIWNVARSISQINEYKGQTLSNPTTQTGLLAYYQFDNLNNKQGNSNFDLTLLGSPKINQISPSCVLGQDPCPKCNLTSSFDVKADICNPAHFSVSNTTSGVTSYLWKFGDNSIIDANTANTEVTYKTAGDYAISLQVSDNNGCSAISSQNVTAAILPNIIKTLPTSVCKGQNITLESFVTDLGTKYKWSPSAQLSNDDKVSTIATMAQTTQFHLDIEKTNGCIYEGDVEISVPDAPTFTVQPSDTSLCPKGNVNLVASGGDSYQWKDADGNIIGINATITVSPSESTKYVIDISSAKCGEHASLNSNINVFPLSSFSIVPSHDIDCANPSTILSVKDAQNVIWEPNGTLAINGLNAIITPNQTTTYTAKAEDQYGCYYNISYTQKVLFDPSGSHFYIPSAFTPNGDGKNDVFKIGTDVGLNKFSLRIFNRYGQLIFRSENQKQGWNGKFRGEWQPTGTYIFELIGNSAFCGEFYKKGTLVLIR